jgi:hypothetical protein
VKLPLFLQSRDIFERHWVAAQELRKAGVRSAVDVGGEGLLARFAPGVACVSVNTNAPADVLYDGMALPFCDGAFDAAVSLDTIEHLPPEKRPFFAGELLRVARRLVLVAVPYGSQTHRELEQRALTAYREAQGTDHEYLKQHVDNGLPDETDMQDLFPGMSLRMGFCGDCVSQYRRFVANLSRRQRPSRVPLAATVHSILRNANFWRSYRLSSTAQESTNRMYLFVDKAPNHGPQDKKSSTT